MNEYGERQVVNTKDQFNILLTVCELILLKVKSGTIWAMLTAPGHFCLCTGRTTLHRLYNPCVNPERGASGHF